MRKPVVGKMLVESNTFKVFFIAILVMSAFLIVYITGRTQKAYAQLFHIPIILSAYYWGIKGSIPVAILSGILVGPFMPLTTSDGTMQGFSGWITLVIIFLVVGLINGALFKINDRLNQEIQEQNFICTLTGKYNTDKLIKDLRNRIEHKEKFSVVSIKLANIEGISKYVHHTLVEQIIKDLISFLECGCKDEALYTYGQDEILIIESARCSYMERINRAIKEYSAAIRIHHYIFRVVLKIGMYECCKWDKSPIDVFNKARIAGEQGELRESGIYYYKNEIEDQRREMFKITGSLLESIHNDELYLVYQPKINLLDNTIIGVEVLTRWNRGTLKPVGSDVFIEIAEEIGFINEISKFVMDKATDQILAWKNKGIDVNVSFNMTSKELLDEEFIRWCNVLIQDKNLDKRIIDFEITERVVSDCEEELIKVLKELIDQGYTISIDDFGTGFNSLMSIVEIPFHELKIDKYFIDRLDRFANRELVNVIISYAHKMNKMVVAEGVETKEQVRILREMQCDRAQGYYFCKPLLPHEFEEFYIQSALHKVT